MTVRWWSQEFAPEGSAAAEGIVKQLGRPALDPLTVLVREAAQNSVDAGRDDCDTVDFRIDVRTLGDAADAWRQILLPAPDGQSGLDVAASLTRESVALVVSDRNTVGLGGEIRANLKHSAERRSDFVQFLRNVGERSDHEFGGGTYGFGKGIFYRLSRCGAILVDTQTIDADPGGRRLMGAALGSSWVLGDRRYTGRHWWGAVSDDGIPDPICGPEAATAASLLGLPGFNDGRTGTDIVVLGADLGTVADEGEVGRARTTHEVANFLASAILWNLWPKFLPDDSGRRVRFAVAVDGNDVEVPSPETLAEFEPFVESLKEIRAGGGVPYTRVTPPRTGGTFSLALTPAERESRRLLVAAACPFEGPPRHVARMRSVELIVDYVAGPPHPNVKLAYGGVFKASPDADRAFAAAEPPTHDDWVVSGLTGSVRGVVQGARTFLTRQLDERLGFGTQAGGSGHGLGQLASRLAGVIPSRASTVGNDGESQVLAGGASPTGADGATSGDPQSSGGSPTGDGSAPPFVGGALAGSSGPRSRPGGPPRVLGAPSLEVFDGTPFAVARVLVPSSEHPAMSQQRLSSSWKEAVRRRSLLKALRCRRWSNGDLQRT